MSQAEPELRPSLEPFKPLLSYNDLEEPLALVKGDALALELLLQGIGGDCSALEAAMQHLVFLMCDHVRSLDEAIKGVRPQ